MPRVGWAGLPGAVRAAVAAVAGPVIGVVPVEAGLTCSFAACLDTAQVRFFVKGASDAGGREGQRWEAAVAPLVAGVGPALRWRVEAAGWEVLGFEWVDGGHADLSPGSADLALVADVLAAAQALRVPDGLPVQPLADRLSEFLNPGERALLSGGSLLHTDTNPHNLLVGKNRAWLVDWAMPATGPAWVDVAYTAVRLMEDGASGEEARAWAAQFPSWVSADPRAVSAFVSATCRQWEARIGPRDCRPSNDRFAVLAA